MNDLTKRIKSALGIEATAPRTTTLTDDTYDNTAGPSSPVDLHAAGPTTDPSASFDDLDDLDDEPLTEEQVMAAASAKLEGLELTTGSWSLLDRACDSISRNTGAGLEDPDAVQRAKELAALFKAADGQLDVIVAAIVASSAPTDAAGNVYSALYRVLNNAVFFANLDYQQAQGMDAFSEDATVQEFFTRYVSTAYVEEALARVVDDRVLGDQDNREKEQEDAQRDAQGFQARREIELDALKERYGATDPEDAVVQALEDIRLYFSLTTESMGWDPSRPMPYSNVREADGSYSPITDAKTAIEAAEIARQASQKRRREKRAATMGAAAQAAAALLAKGLQRPTVHQRK